jgi:pimeloyl-ACP methyl ester carboxylesterase
MDGGREVVTSPDGTPIGLLTAGVGSPLLLVHGGLSGRSRFAPLWAQLTGSFRVTAIDRRGRGSSGDAATYDIAREYEDVAAVAHHLASVTGGPVDVFGHSVSGVVVLGAAPPGPDDVLAIASRTLVREAEALAALGLPAVARAVRQPVLLRGTAGPPWGAEVLAVLIAALPDAEVEELVGEGHEGVDTAATAVAALLTRFLGS